MFGHWPSERARTNDLHLSIPKETAEEALEPMRYDTTTTRPTEAAAPQAHFAASRLQGHMPPPLQPLQD